MSQPPPLTAAQDARIRQTIQATVEDWLGDYDIPPGKEHRQLVNRLCAAVEAIHQNGVFTINQGKPRGAEGGL